MSAEARMRNDLIAQQMRVWAEVVEREARYLLTDKPNASAVLRNVASGLRSAAALSTQGETAPAPVDEQDRTYYGKALDLLADQLSVLPADEWEGRKWKAIAILRNAASATAAVFPLPPGEGLEQLADDTAADIEIALEADYRDAQLDAMRSVILAALTRARAQEPQP